MKKMILTLLLLICLTTRAQKWEPVNHEFDSLSNLMESTLERRTPDIRMYGWTAKMGEIAERHNSDVMRWRTLYFRGFTEALYNHGRNAKILYRQALEMVDSSRYYYDYRRIRRGAQIYRGTTRLIDQYRDNMSDLRYYQSVGSRKDVAYTLIAIGHNYYISGQLEKALDAWQRGQEEYRKAGFEGPIMYNHISQMNIFDILGDRKRLLETHKMLMESPIIQNDTVAKIFVFNNAKAFNIDPPLAVEGYRLACEYGELAYRLMAANTISAYYIQDLHDPVNGIKYARVCYDSIRGSGSFQSDEFFEYALTLLAAGYEMLEMPDSALKYMEEYVAYSDSMRVINDPGKFQELYDRMALEREEEHVAAEHERARSRILTLVLVFTLLLVAAGGVVYYLYTRRKIKIAENKELAAKVENESLQRRLYQEQCENRERELTTNSLLLIEKKKMIDHLNRQIAEKGEQGKIDPATRRELLAFIKTHQGTEEGLRQFYDYFNNVHPDFFRRLRERFPELTKGDLRVCAYLRIGLDSKQMAQVLSIQPEAVKQARYRLRKKLALPTGASLEDFIASIP